MRTLDDNIIKYEPWNSQTAKLDQENESVVITLNNKIALDMVFEVASDTPSDTPSSSTAAFPERFFKVHALF